MAFVKMCFRAIAAIALLAALAAAIADIARSIANQSLTLEPLGLTWRKWHPSSLQQAEFGVQQYVSPDAWYSVVTPMLLLPTALVFAGLALVLYLIGHRYRRPRVAIAR
ncbi:MAG: hypothetical protein AAGH82_11465 [Pseudomonadota bacterium]